MLIVLVLLYVLAAGCALAAATIAFVELRDARGRARELLTPAYGEDAWLNHLDADSVTGVSHARLAQLPGVVSEIMAGNRRRLIAVAVLVPASILLDLAGNLLGLLR